MAALEEMHYGAKCLMGIYFEMVIALVEHTCLHETHVYVQNKTSLGAYFKIF